MTTLRVTRKNGVVDIRIIKGKMSIKRNFFGSRILTSTDVEEGNGVFGPSGPCYFMRSEKENGAFDSDNSCRLLHDGKGVTVVFHELLPTEPKSNAPREVWERWAREYSNCLMKRVHLVTSALADDFEINLEMHFS